MGLARDLMWLGDRSARKGRQRARDKNARAKYRAQKARERELDGAFKSVLDALQVWGREVIASGLHARARTEDAKRPSREIVAYSSDQAQILYGKAAVRSAVCYPLGAWFGEFTDEGRRTVLVERDSRVQKFASSDQRDEADAVWDAVSQWVGNLNDSQS